MGVEDLERMAQRQADAQIETVHKAWSATQTNLDTIIGQQAALNNARILDFFLANAHYRSGVPKSGDGKSLEETVRELLATRETPASGNITATATTPMPAPAQAETGSPLTRWLAPLAWPLLGALLGGAGLGYALLQRPATPPAAMSPDSQENYRYNYLEARGLHLPPENGDPNAQQ